MATFSFNFKHKVLDIATDPNKYNEVVKETLNKLSISLQDFVKEQINRSNEVSSIINNSADPEALRAIIRGIKVQIHSNEPIKLTVIFKDDIGHWYQQGDLPKELQAKLTNLFKQAIQDWLRSNKPSVEFGKVLGV